MKYIISESKMNSSIERFLRSSFSEVVDVKFRRVGIVLGSETPSRRIERTNIQILIDPEGILKGNFNPDKGDLIGYDLKLEIWRTIDSMFSLNMKQYGSEWDIEFKTLSII
jgi:hypothetical protein